MATRTQAKVYFERRSQTRPETPLISLIVPVFNEAEVIPLFLEETDKALSALGLPFEYIFVDDGSHDTTADVIAQKLKDGLPGKLIGLSRNFGKEAALTAGLSHVSGDVAIVLDADLQDPPSLIPQMVEGWRSGYDVVYGMRVDRSSDTFLKRSTAGLFYKLFNRLAHINMPANAGDFRLIDRAVIEALHKLPERNRFMKGLFAWVGFPSMAIPYERPARRAGEGKWNYWKLWNFAIDGLTAFTTLPLRVWLYGGVGIAGLALVYALYTVIKVLIYGVDVPGYASLMVAVLFFSGIQLLSIGMVGEYIARLFGEAKQRPVYLVQDVITGADAKTDSKARDD